MGNFILMITDGQNSTILQLQNYQHYEESLHKKIMEISNVNCLNLFRAQK